MINKSEKKNKLKKDGKVESIFRNCTNISQSSIASEILFDAHNICQE